METNAIQRQYDDLIASNYDLDPQGITSKSLDLVVDSLHEIDLLAPGQPELRVLDLGMGTGMFLEKIMQPEFREIAPFGVDLSEGMAEIARSKIPSLQCYVDDAANFDEHFFDSSFDLICTHFITGFVPIEHLAPLIFNRLEPGGCWSFIGSSKASYPKLRQHANSKLLQLVFGGKDAETDDVLCPENEACLRQQLVETGFEIVSSDTYEPELQFNNFDDFMEFAYEGGWLTPFVEKLGLQNLSRPIKRLLNTFVFPMTDHHNILVGLARKPRL